MLKIPHFSSFFLKKEEKRSQKEERNRCDHTTLFSCFCITGIYNNTRANISTKMLIHIRIFGMLGVR